MANFSFEEAYGPSTSVAPAPAPAPKKVVVPAVAMPLPAASAPASNPNAALVAAFQTRNASAPAASAAPAMPALPPPPKIQPGEAPVNFKRRLSEHYQRVDQMKMEAVKEAEKAALAAEKTKTDANQKKARSLEQMPDLISSAKSILQGTGVDEKGQPIKTPLPTQSYGGMALNALGGIIGKTPPGAAEADRLKVIGGAMVMAMPRMEGPQSDADVKLYREMAGRVGDETIPIERRLASLNEVEKLYSKYNKNSGWKVVP
jgi:hypothetical protein